MPSKERYQRLKIGRELEEHVKNNPQVQSPKGQAINRDFADLCKEIQADYGRRAAAYASDSNARRAAEAKARLMEFTARHKSFIETRDPARKVAYQ